MQAAEILAGVSDAKLTSKPAFIASRAAILEAAGKADSALELVEGAYKRSLENKQQPAAGKKAVDTALLPILARLQLRVSFFLAPL